MEPTIGRIVHYTLSWATSRTFGDGPGHWVWPPRVS
jgi:hypothetical protein